MGVLDRIGEAAATFGGDEAGAQRFSEARKRKQRLSDEELKNQTTSILADVDALHERRAKLDPNSPTYQQDLKTIDQALHDARQVFTDLYHPAKNPGALDKLGGFITSHLGRRKKKTDAPATPAQAKQSMTDRIAGIESAAFGQSQAENPYTKLRRQLKESSPNMTDEQLDEAVRIQAGIEAKPSAAKTTWKEYVSPDGKQSQWFDVTDPDSIPKGWQAIVPRSSSAAASKPKKVWSKTKEGKVFSVNVDPQTNQPIPGTENYNDIPLAGLVTHLSYGQFHFYDDKGNLHEVQEERRSVPMVTGPGGNESPTPDQDGVPKTPAQAKERLATPPKDRILGHKDTPTQSKARTHFTQTVGFEKEVGKIAEDQAKGEHVAIRQKRILVKLERLAAGRFTTQAVQYIQKAGWGNSIEQWANNVTTGELPADVWSQVMKAVKDEEISAKEEMKASGLDTGTDSMEELRKKVLEHYTKKPKTTP